MVFIPASTAVLLVFGLTTWALTVAIKRDLAQLGTAWELQAHLLDYLKNSSNVEALMQDVSVAAKAMVGSEITVFVFVQWLVSAYAAGAMVTIFAFLGSLSSRETSRLSERLIKFIIFKVVFCGALIVPDIFEIMLWLAWFSMAGFMRIFMGAAKDRLEALSVSPSASSSAHARAVALVFFILLHDVAGTMVLVASVGTLPMHKVLLCAYDLVVVLVDGLKTLLRYGVHLLDQHFALRSMEHADAGAAAAAAGGAPAAEAAPSSALGWEHWEGKGSLLYHTELIADLVVHMLTLAHYVHIWYLHGLSVQVIDAILFLDLRSILASMIKRVKGHLSYRHATRCLQHAFPDAVLDSTHDCCPICMNRMSTAKRLLPCGHLFHLACLRAWLQQSGAESFSCPLCRTPLMQVRSSVAERRWVVFDRLSQLSERVNHSILVTAMLLGLPLSASVLQQHQQYQARLQARALRRRLHRDHPNEEQVGESPHPSPADVRRRAVSAPRRLDNLLRRLFSRSGAPPPPPPATPLAPYERPAVDETDSGSDDPAAELGPDSEDGEEVRPAVAERAAAAAAAAAAEAPSVDRGGALAGPSAQPSRQQQQQQQQQQAGDGAGVSLRLVQPPAEPLVMWSELAATRMANTIRSSLAMGVIGGAAIAGHDRDDEMEVTSPHTGRRPSQRGSSGRKAKARPGASPLEAAAQDSAGRQGEPGDDAGLQQSSEARARRSGGSAAQRQRSSRRTNQAAADER